MEQLLTTSYELNIMDILLSTTNEIVGYRVKKTIGIVCGEEFVAVDAGSDFFAGLKSNLGGKIKTYKNLMTEARNSAEGNIIKEAESFNADAIIGVKYVKSSTSEILVYGTAVKLEKL